MDNSWHERKEPSDELGSVVLLGSDMGDNVTAPVIPVGRAVHLMGRKGPVDRSCLVDTQVMSEPSVLLGLRTDWMDDAAVGPVGHDGNLSEPDTVGHRLDPTGSRRETDRPVFTEKREDTPTGPVGLEVVLAEDMSMMNRPDPVGHHGETEQSVFLSPDADQEGHIPTNSVHPGVMMFPTQPVADGPAGPDRARRSVGHVEMYPVHDEDRQMAGGPVGRFPCSDLLQTNEMSVLNERCRLLATGSMDAADMYPMDESCRPMTGGPLGRLLSLDPRGPSGVSTLDEGRQSPYVAFTAKPWTNGHRDDRTGEVDYDSTTQTRSELGSATGVWDPVIQKDSGFQTVRVNASPDNGLTNSRGC